MEKDEQFVKLWQDRWKQGEKAKKAWEDDYEIPLCKMLWKGKQLDDPLDEYGQRRVQINRVHPTVRASMPALYFSAPYAKIKAMPARAQTPGQKAGLSIDDKAQILQDTTNMFIKAPKVNFEESTSLAVKESHWAFGCVRVMHDAIPVENPSIDAPPLKEGEKTPLPPGVKAKGEPSNSVEGEKRFGEVLGLSEDVPKVREERFYVKRIPSRQVICSADQSGTIEENPWLGYWSIAYIEDLKRSKLYKNTADLKSSGTSTREDEGDKNRKEEDKLGADKVKLLHIWDQRTKHYYVLAEGHDKILLDEKFKRLPLKFLRFDVDPDEFLPIPPIYHEIHPQYEINDSREWLRLNRKGTVPRYTYDEDAIEDSEMKKLESGNMGTYIKRKPNTHGAIEAVPQPNYSQVAAQTLALATGEFDELSMVSSERRGVPGSKTATQAKIVDIRTQTQEDYNRNIVAKFLAEVAKELMELAIEEMALTQWVIMNADPSATGFALETARIKLLTQEISAFDLEDAVDGIEWEVTIDTETLSPVAEQERRAEWLQGLELLRDPLMSRLLAVSPEIRKRTLSLYGMKSARDQELIGQALMILTKMQMAEAAAGAKPQPGVASHTAPQPGGPPGIGAGPNAGAGGPDTGGMSAGGGMDGGGAGMIQ